jgi:hypothetical protein
MTAKLRKYPMWNYGIKEARTKQERFELLIDIIRRKRLKSVDDALWWTEITRSEFKRQFPEASKERKEIENLINLNIEYN